MKLKHQTLFDVISGSFEVHSEEILKETLTRSKRQHGKIKERFLWPNASVPLLFDPTVISKISTISLI